MGNLNQETEEPLAYFYAQIREVAKKCEYSDEDDAIRDHLIKTMQNTAIHIKAIRRKWTFNKRS